MFDLYLCGFYIETSPNPNSYAVKLEMLKICNTSFLCIALNAKENCFSLRDLNTKAFMTGSDRNIHRGYKI